MWGASREEFNDRNEFVFVCLVGQHLLKDGWCHCKEYQRLGSDSTKSLRDLNENDLGMWAYFSCLRCSASATTAKDAMVVRNGPRCHSMWHPRWAAFHSTLPWNESNAIRSFTIRPEYIRWLKVSWIRRSFCLFIFNSFIFNFILFLLLLPKLLP